MGTRVRLRAMLPWRQRASENRINFLLTGVFLLEDPILLTQGVLILLMRKLQ